MHVAVVGSGHSAFNTLLDLTRLADDTPGTAITWIVRTPPAKDVNLFGGGEDDDLPVNGRTPERPAA